MNEGGDSSPSSHHISFPHEDHFISSLMDNGDATSASTTSSSTSTVHASSTRLPATATFLERERQRKMMYRRRMKDEAAHLQEMCTHLESRRVQLIRRRERRLQQSPEEKRAIEQWALTVQTMRDQNAATMQYNATLRDSIRQQILMAMSYQRTVRHALHHMNLSLANDERKRDNIHRLLVHQRAQLEHIRVKWVNSCNSSDVWANSPQGEDKCNVTFNAAQTDIAHAEIVRCRRFQNTQPAVAANRIWLQLTGDTTHHSTAKLAPRIAQRLDTIDPATIYTRVYMNDDVAPFGLNVVQHRQDLLDRHLIMYRTMEDGHTCFDDVIKWDVVCWLEVTQEDSDTLVKEYISYTQVGHDAILPALLGCDADNGQVAAKQSKLRAWMQQVVSKLYSGCKVPLVPSTS
ncbi:hypothetical protein AaE_007807 [Aphanomyces astaci]|uniref:Uncharacterized protein n=1 Tax=Aphanomyces astaci TaxID=112090 RepID=A0A6A5A982_APHAT|nr:hypothetical protein AaE_007807 [Aphanomyces astaci]